ncbi:MAG: DUF4393 domain-containing protein [Bacilli bacterium]|nr:DUF4393 domain-containing protein [Bacilli bacterium]
MTDEVLEITKEVAKVVAKDVYNDGLKGTVTQTGEIVESIVGLFNNVVFYPVKKANALFKYKLEDFKNDLETRLNSLPDDKIVEPDLMVAGPALESLKYTYDKEELRNMYLNLLVSSMNKDTKDKAHPSYVEIIRQLTPLDAKVFKRLNDVGQVACAHPVLKLDNTNKVYVSAYPNYIVEELLDLGDEFDISASISNLIRLGLIHHEDNSIIGYNYEKFKSFNIIIRNKQILDNLNNSEGNGITTSVEIKKQVIMKNNFGERFADTCL